MDDVLKYTIPQTSQGASCIPSLPTLPSLWPTKAASTHPDLYSGLSAPPQMFQHTYFRSKLVTVKLGIQQNRVAFAFNASCQGGVGVGGCKRKANLSESQASLYSEALSFKKGVWGKQGNPA